MDTSVINLKVYHHPYRGSGSHSQVDDPGLGPCSPYIWPDSISSDLFTYHLWIIIHRMQGSSVISCYNNVVITYTCTRLGWPIYRAGNSGMLTFYTLQSAPWPSPYQLVILIKLMWGLISKFTAKIKISGYNNVVITLALSHNPGHFLCYLSTFRLYRRNSKMRKWLPCILWGSNTSVEPLTLYSLLSLSLRAL